MLNKDGNTLIRENKVKPIPVIKAPYKKINCEKFLKPIPESKNLSTNIAKEIKSIKIETINNM